MQCVYIYIDKCVQEVYWLGQNMILFWKPSRGGDLFWCQPPTHKPWMTVHRSCYSRDNQLILLSNQRDAIKPTRTPGKNTLALCAIFADIRPGIGAPSIPRHPRIWFTHIKSLNFPLVTQMNNIPVFTFAAKLWYVAKSTGKWLFYAVFYFEMYAYMHIYN